MPPEGPWGPGRFLEDLAAGLCREGDTFGAHLCQLLTGERTLEAVDAPSSLVCLLGVEHRSPENFASLLEPLALHLSEAFEYAVRVGNADTLFPTIQPFKLAHATLLADVGLTDKAGAPGTRRPSTSSRRCPRTSSPTLSA
ncbi:unnamed protein product [Prorocentrum cordatum]|uniref:Sec16 Sec23-binding domain-containing protein n=1 Tax=Prorocentrum cordatum TaxID=2364126 RepID=A0ABN9WVK7_9DINO|nr:unnamed protein product [Polarella glacialis]